MDGDVRTYGNPADSWGQPYGQSDCSTAPTPAGCISDGQIWTATIIYDGALLNVVVQDGDSAPYQVITNYPVDLTKALGGTVAYVGFTAATGGGFANFDVLNWQFDTSETILHSFSGKSEAVSADGAHPVTGLVADTSGALYDTTLRGGPNLCQAGGAVMESCGAVFKLTPPATTGGAWTESVLYAFSKATGWAPEGPLAFDPTTNTLYGTTVHGGSTHCALVGCGTVYALQLPSGSGSAVATVLHSFTNRGDGIIPISGVVLDGASGALYGTTKEGGIQNAGVIFKLTPPASSGGAWSYSDLYRFTGGADGATPGSLVEAASGVLYGTTSAGGNGGKGVAYQLAPPVLSGGSWTQSPIYSFAGGTDGKIPSAGLFIDQRGRLYGTTSAGGGTGCGGTGCGTVFRLTPPTGSGSWVETLLYAFTGAATDGKAPNSTLVGAPGGSPLYGTTGAGGASGLGTVFSLTAPTSGKGAWTPGQVHDFAGTADGATPAGALYMDAAGVLYGTAEFSGGHGAGVVYAIQP